MQRSVDASFIQDKERHVSSYVYMNTENVRKRVLASGNGHSPTLSLDI